jgi:hypothetical protein
VFHLTSARRWASILQSAELVSRAELERRGIAEAPPSSLGEARLERMEREVVWLTINPLPRDRWVDLGGENRADVIITVDADALAWTNLARRQGFSESYLRRLRELGNPSEWYVSLEPIPAADWKRVQEGRAGHRLWERGTPLSDALVLCLSCKRSLRRDETETALPLCAECREVAELPAAARADDVVAPETKRRSGGGVSG